jgi:hypothetical protein
MTRMTIIIGRMLFDMPNNQGQNTDPHSEYVKFISFQRQQWLRERA